MISLKHPQVRIWFHPKKGEDYYYSWPGTKSNIYQASLMKRKVIKGKVIQKPLIAFGRKEYAIQTFLKLHPKYKLTNENSRKEIRNQLKKTGRFLLKGY